MWLQDIALGRIDDGFVDQHDWDAVPYRVNAVALAALQTLSVVFQRQRLLADRADQDVEQVLGNHERILRLFRRGKRGEKSLTAKDAKKDRKDRK
jgi:hypothetical protein